MFQIIKLFNFFFYVYKNVGNDPNTSLIKSNCVGTKLLIVLNLLFSCIDEAVKFPGLETFPTPNYSTKQLISREIDLEQLRRRMPSVELNNTNEVVDKMDENENKFSTPRSVKG